jgi:hypothetical protein
MNVVSVLVKLKGLRLLLACSEQINCLIIGESFSRTLSSDPAKEIIKADRLISLLFSSGVFSAP